MFFTNLVSSFAYHFEIIISAVRQNIKTVAELEADMHQNSMRKEIPVPASSGNAHQAGDMTAFNKLLTMVNAAKENQTVVSGWNNWNV